MRLTTEEIDEIWQSLSIGEEEIDMHEYAEAIEAAVLAKIASGQEPADLDQIIDAYLEGYVFEGGEDGSHTPNEGERLVIKDAFLGLLGDPDWDAAWRKVIGEQAQLASGQEPVGEREASEVWIESESFKVKAPLKDGGVSNRFSFNCSGGCGECGIKVIEFVSYSKQGDEDERWVTIASEPQLISACCGSPVEIYDDLIRDFCAAVEAVSYIPAPAQQPIASEQEPVATVIKKGASRE
jgi:hypothetical protein